MCTSELGSIGEFLTGIGTLALSSTAAFAFFSYRRQIKQETMKWMQQLYDNFYTSDRYKSIRQRIDFEDLEGLFELLKKSDADPRALNHDERSAVDQFTDYLNFFEWVAFLERAKQLTFDDVDTMFKYYLIRMLQVDQNQQLRTYIRHNGYEQLNSLLNHYSKVHGG